MGMCARGVGGVGGWGELLTDNDLRRPIWLKVPGVVREVHGRCIVAGQAHM